MEEKKGGRPEITLDWNKIDHLLSCGCSGMQVAAYFGVHHDTLYDRVLKEKQMAFSDYSAKMKQKGNSLLLAKQQEVALKGNTSMLIWLGKNRLEQRDNDKDQEKIPPNDLLNTAQILLAKSQNEINELKAKLNALQPQTSQVDSGSQPPL